MCAGSRIWRRARKAGIACRQLLKRPLTLSSAVQVALLNNRGLQATFEEIGLSFADVREARTLANPEVDLSMKLPNQPPKHPLYEWGLAQNFLDLLMLPLRTKVAREQLAAAQLRVSDEVIKLTAEVKTAYYELLADQSLIERLRVIREAQSVSLELMQKLHEAGNVTDLKLTQEQLQYSQLRLELAKAEAELREHREKLNRLLGVWGSDTGWKLAASELPRTPQPRSTPRSSSPRPSPLQCAGPLSGCLRAAMAALTFPPPSAPPSPPKAAAHRKPPPPKQSSSPPNELRADSTADH